LAGTLQSIADFVEACSSGEELAVKEAKPLVAIGFGILLFKEVCFHTIGRFTSIRFIFIGGFFTTWL